MEKHLHIVCFDVPYPLNYGGTVDPFCKIRALSETGIRIHLHCFEYGRGRQPELEKYCAQVHYYERGTGHRGLSFRLPYIVASRMNEALFRRLLEDDHPILLEGVHCSWPVFDHRFDGRKIVVRTHNVEEVYYRMLAAHSRNLFKKIYYIRESRLLRKYEKELARNAVLLTVSDRDTVHYRTVYSAAQCGSIPVFLPYDEVSSQEGTGYYCLFHGNLSVEENHQAACFLLNEVFNDMDIPLVIAGHSPAASLVALAHRKKHTCIVADPGPGELQDMIAKAQLNILPSYVNTGVKLKLLNALFQGRHCVVNNATVSGSGLEQACHVASGAEAFKQLVRELFRVPFTKEDVQARRRLFEEGFDQAKNTEKLIRYLW